MAYPWQKNWKLFLYVRNHWFVITAYHYYGSDHYPIALLGLVVVLKVEKGTTLRATKTHGITLLLPFAVNNPGTLQTLFHDQTKHMVPKDPCSIPVTLSVKSQHSSYTQPMTVSQIVLYQIFNCKRANWFDQTFKSIYMLKQIT